MSLRIGVVASLLCLIAQPVAAASVRDLGGCVDAADRAICLLKLAGADDSGFSLFADRDFGAHPEILAAAGFTRAGAEQWQASQPPALRVFSAPLDAARKAAADVLALDKAGRPVGEAMAPIVTLAEDSGALPPFFADSQTTSPRLIVYWLLIGGDRSSPERPSPALARALLEAWEDELRRRGGIADEQSDPLALAKAYAAVGDDAGADRAVDLAPRAGDATRIALLAKAGRLDRAIALSRTATVEAQLEWTRAQVVDGELDRPATWAEASAALASGDELEPPAADEAYLRAMSEGDLTTARVELVWAATRAGRADLARETADGVLRHADPAEELAAALLNTPDLVAAATPSVATAWLEALERGVRPAEGEDEGWAYRTQERLQAIGGGWLRMGRTDRFDALATRWRPTAIAELEAVRTAGRGRPTPYATALSWMLLGEDRVDEAEPLMSFARSTMLLENDLKRGRGVVNLDRYLSQAREPGEAWQLLHGCTWRAPEAGDYVSAFACLKRLAALRPDAPDLLVDRAMDVAARAARRDDRAIARELTSFAMTTARDRPVAAGDRPGDSTAIRWNLREVAKMELRADGRLPPLAPGGER